jgi:prophage maintenance system killer protein
MINGRQVEASQPDVVSVMLGVAASEVTEEILAAWIAEKLVAVR